MRVFISHSSIDKQFVSGLAGEFEMLGIPVWYDDWEIKVGDSIVEKVFDGLEKSDALVIVLSQASVNSRWVKEELNTALLRRINDSDILILPVLKEDCEIPTALKQLRYADFRSNPKSGLVALLDAIEPTRTLWQSLKLLGEHHELVVQQIKAAELDSKIDDQIMKLHELMTAALDLRCQIEIRHANVVAEQRDFFRKIEGLAELGLDVRSQTWNDLVSFRARIAHNYGNTFFTARDFARLLQDRYDLQDERAILDKALDRLSQVMQVICEYPIERQGDRATSER